MNPVYDMLGPEGFGTYEVDWAAPVFTPRRVSAPPKALLVPGFVDLHIHGAFGIDFMSADAADMAALCDKLAELGYEAFLPTTVTASADDVLRALEVLPDHPIVPGFHLEGPFLSPEFPGAQPPHAIVDPPLGPSAWDAVLDHPRLRLVTLAPERPHALELIRRLAGRGVIVSLGHTNATFAECQTAFQFGASHTTHTFNAMRGLHHREAGTVGYALTNPALRTELIYDRLHVSREAAGVLQKCKPPEGVLAVSDSTMATGLPAGHRFTMWNLDVVKGRGDVRLASNDALAGSAITLLDAFRNLAEDFGVETAIRACCLNPRRALGWTAPPRILVELDREYRVVRRHLLATEP